MEITAVSFPAQLSRNSARKYRQNTRELLFGRKMRIKLPEVSPTVIDCDLRCKDATAKRKMKEYADDRNNAKPATFQIGDDVLVRQRKRNKFSSYNNPIPYHIYHTIPYHTIPYHTIPYHTIPYHTIPYHIAAIKGSMITAENAKHKITRNSSHFKKITRPSTCGSTTNDDDGEDEDIPNSDIEEPGIQEQPQRRYPLRLNRGQPPNRFSVPQ